MIQAVLDACTSFTQVTEYLLQVEPEMVEHPSAVRCQQRLILKTVEDIIQLPYQHAHVDARVVSLLELAEVRSHCPFSSVQAHRTVDTSAAKKCVTNSDLRMTTPGLYTRMSGHIVFL